MIATGYLLGFGYGVLCLLAAFLLSRLGVKKAITRKLVHIFIGFEWVILYAFHGATYHFLIVCLCFLALLIVAYKKRLLQMISSDGDNAPGTVYYAVSMSLMALASLIDQRFILPFGLAVFVTSLGDGFAGLLGGLVKKHNPKIDKQKTLVGALANFVLSTATALAFMTIFEDMGLTPTHCLVIGALSVGIELISGFGLDNITLPILVATFTYISTAFYAETVKYFLPIALTPLIISFVVERKNLTRGGTIAAIFLDIAVSISLGNLGFLLLLTFLALGILTDKLKRKNTECKEEKSSHRDASQVLANGLVPIVCAAIYFAIGERAFLACPQLKGISVPSPICKLGAYAFGGCTGLQDENGFVILNHILFGYFGTEANVAVPADVTVISRDAFSWNTNLLCVQLPEGLTEIGESAFLHCAKLTHINIPETVKHIGSCAFLGCAGLKSLHIPKSVTQIGSGAFYGCEEPIFETT